MPFKCEMHHDYCDAVFEMLPSRELMSLMGTVFARRPHTGFCEELAERLVQTTVLKTGRLFFFYNEGVMLWFDPFQWAAQRFPTALVYTRNNINHLRFVSSALTTIDD